VPKVSESFLTLQSTGDRGQIILSGRRVSEFVSVVVTPLTDGGSPKGITPSLGSVARDGTRSLMFTVATGAAPGKYQIDLTDRRSSSVTLDFTLTLEGAPDEPPIVSDVAAPKSVNAGQTFEVTVSARDDQGLAQIQVRARADVTNENLGGETESKQSLTMTLAAGEHELQIVAIDNAGNESDPFSVVVESVASNQPPADSPRLLELEVPPAISPGQSSVVGVTLDRTAPAGGVEVVLNANSADLELNGSPLFISEGDDYGELELYVAGGVEVDRELEITAILSGMELSRPILILSSSSEFQPATIDVGGFQVVIVERLSLEPFEPVTISVGAFLVAIESLAATAEPFQPVTIRVGNFRVVVVPPNGGEE